VGVGGWAWAWGNLGLEPSALVGGPVDAGPGQEYGRCDSARGGDEKIQGGEGEKNTTKASPKLGGASLKVQRIQPERIGHIAWRHRGETQDTYESNRFVTGL
jgi:hypothetical protein